MMPPLTLPQAITLIAIKRYQGHYAASRFRYIMAAAQLADLYLSGGVEIHGRLIKKVTLIDQGDDPGESEDAVITVLKAAKRDKSMRSIIKSLGETKACNRAPLDSLVSTGELTLETRKMLFLFKSKTYTISTPDRIDVLHSRLLNVIDSTDPYVPAFEGSLILFLRDAALMQGMFEKSVLKAHKKRLRQIGLGKMFETEELRNTLAGLRSVMIMAAQANRMRNKD